MDGNWYYFYETDTNFARLCTDGFRTIDGDYYFFDRETGVCFTGGWLSPEKSGSQYWHYFESNGKSAKGWKQINGQWYYFGAEGTSRNMRTGIITIDGKKYCLGESGVMRKGWAKYNGYYYYADGNGVLLIGWQKIGGKIYNFDNNARMRTGLVKIDNLPYDFGQNGVCINPPASVT